MAVDLADLVIEEETIEEASGDYDLPELGLVEQQWDVDSIPAEEAASVAAESVDSLDLDSVPPGGTVAIGVGSRGIENLQEIVRGTVEALKDKGVDPFVFPAMGSHGGATAEGQREKLASYGITEETIGCEIRSSMETEPVAVTPERGVSVHADANAVEADAILPINRVKPHTMFFGDVESGLSKMLVIGMGKQRGAKTAHAWAVDWSFRKMIPEIASTLVEELPVIGGIAVVENEAHETAIVEGVPPEGFLHREAELLEIAYDRLPTIPFEEIDVAVFDRMGKNVSGSGMDTNVVGRISAFYESAPDTPHISRIFTRSLTDASHGNAAGLGMADFVHQDLLSDLDLSKTFINGLTASSPRGARLPPTVETDRAGLVASISTIGVVHGGPDDVRMVRATDTQDLERFYASPALVERARNREDLAVREDPSPIEFDEGNFAEPTPMDRTIGE
ncbi:MAG: DUF362 domain-containing protein [Halodesulfurarchaeum sp.]